MTGTLLAAPEAASLPAVPGLRSRSLRNPWTRIRVQMGGGLITALAIPALAAGLAGTGPGTLVTHGMNAFALVAGFVAYRKMAAYPAAALLMMPVAAFGAAWLTATLIVLSLGLPVVAGLGLVSAVLTTGWIWLTGTLAARRQCAIYVLAPGVTRRDLSAAAPDFLLDVREPREADLLAPLPIIAGEAEAAGWGQYLQEARISGREVITPAGLIEARAGRLQIAGMADLPQAQAGEGTLYPRLKRGLDVVMALAGLLLLWPLLLAVALAIRIDSPGPAIFRQQRMGYRGVPFTVWKFRSMHVAASGEPAAESLSADMTREGDARITRIGQVLRRFRIDELPQLVNILAGDMSLIGPRPETIALSRYYETTLPRYRYRHMVRPGITGWAQVNQGHVTSAEEVATKLEYDFYYVRHLCLWLDVLILLLTIRVVLTGHGAR